MGSAARHLLASTSAADADQALSVCTELSSAVSPDTPFMQQGRHVKAALTKTGLKWQYCSMKLWPMQAANGSSESGNGQSADQRPCLRDNQRPIDIAICVLLLG